MLQVETKRAQEHRERRRTDGEASVLSGDARNPRWLRHGPLTRGLIRWDGRGHRQWFRSRYMLVVGRAGGVVPDACGISPVTGCGKWQGGTNACG